MRPVAVLFIALCALPAAADTLVVANKADATVWLVEPESGLVHARFDVGVGPHEVAASPDGRFAAVANYGNGSEEGSTLTIIEVAEARIFRAVDLGEYTRPHGLSWLDRSRLLVTSESSQSLLVVDVWTGSVSRALPTDARVSHMVAPHPLHHRAYVANIADGTMTTLEVDCGSHRVATETGAGAEGIAVRPDGREAWVANRAANTVTIVNLDTMDVAAQLQAGEFPIRVAFAPDGVRAFVTNARGGDLWVYDVATREVVAAVALSDGNQPVPIGLLVDPSGGEVYVALTGQSEVVVVDTRTFRIKRRFAGGGQPDGMAWCSAEPAPTAGVGKHFHDLYSFLGEPGRQHHGS
jgi:YVTN family beta-propeller protein